MKRIASLGALSLCGFLSATSVGSVVPAASPAAATLAGGDACTAGDADDSAIELAMSDEERDRREGICDQMLKNCRERCINWKLKGKKLQDCRDTCNANWDDCIADIR